MQKAILGYGKTSAGKYRPLLVDNVGRLVVEGISPTALPTPTGPGADPAPFIKVVNGSAQVIPQANTWTTHVFVKNEGNTPGTIDIPELVAQATVNPGDSEEVFLQPGNRTAIFNVTTSGPLRVCVYFKSYAVS